MDIALPTLQQTTSRKRAFDSSSVPEFLENGWLVALDSSRIALGWGEWTESSAPAGEACLYTPDFYLESATPWRFTKHWDIVDRTVFADRVLTGVAAKVPQHGFQWLEPDFESFASGPWKEIQDGFRSRGLEKAVPVVYAQARGAVSVASLLVHLVTVPTSLYPYGFWSSAEGQLGATPEILFRTSEGVVETMTVAGTIAKTPGAEAELLADPKERHEHQLVIDDIVERLSRVGAVTVGETRALELPTLIHLFTPISARASIGFEDLVRLMHPTAALGVSPRELGNVEIRRWDNASERGRFGAPFGVVTPDDKVCLVGIRCLEWQNESVRMGSGCGIVPASRLEREWNELALKRRSVRGMLGL